MKTKFVVLLFLLTQTPYSLAEKAEHSSKVELTEVGLLLKKQYAEYYTRLKSELGPAIITIDQDKKSAVIQALKNEAAAKKALEEAKKNVGSIRHAQAFVGHAKLKWIAGADKNLEAAQEELKRAKTAADLEAAQNKIVKWRKNREAGVVALKEREAALASILKSKTDFLKAEKQATHALSKAKTSTSGAVKNLGIQFALKNDKWDAKLAKYLVLFEATPEGLAVFAQRGDAEKKLIDTLLSSDDLLVQMAVADGARGGKYGKAMQIYSDIAKASDKVASGPLQRLALAVALEHAVPIKQNNAKAETGAPTAVDPVKRYLHFEKAFLNGELDPAFKSLSVRDYRMVVNGQEPDEILAWGRSMLRNYRPDHISTDDYRWRYVMSVRTDVGHATQVSEFDKPELHVVQNTLANGGKAWRKASFGCFILRSFGIPVIMIRQARGHSALAHWAPQGWVTCLGADWGKGRPMARHDRDLDFLANTRARTKKQAFMQVKRAQWLGDLVGETRIWGLQSGVQPGFWYGVSLYLQHDIITGDKLDVEAEIDSNDHKSKAKREAASVSTQDKKVVIDSDGVITIPAVACSKPTESTRKIKFMPSNLGGMQLHYSLVGKREDFEYTFNVHAAGRYELNARVVTTSWDQQLRLAVNGSKETSAINLPYTLGMWGETQPVVVDLTSGENVLVFSRDHDRLKGVTIKNFKLTPLN